MKKRQFTTLGVLGVSAYEPSRKDEPSASLYCNWLSNIQKIKCQRRPIIEECETLLCIVMLIYLQKKCEILGWENTFRLTE